MNRYIDAEQREKIKLSGVAERSAGRTELPRALLLVSPISLQVGRTPRKEREQSAHPRPHPARLRPPRHPHRPPDRVPPSPRSRLSLEVYEAEFDSLIDDSVSASRTVARDLRTVQEAEEPREKGKRGKPVCSWWKNESRELSYPHKVLFSPYVCNETLATIGMEEFSWVVVTPSLYRLFSKHELFLKGEPYDRLVVGIPVVLESAHYPPTLTYDLSSTEIRRVELYSFNRCSYAFVGHVEAK